MTYCRIHALCVRTKYPADDSTIECDLNLLGGFNFYTVLPPGYSHTGYLMHS